MNATFSFHDNGSAEPRVVTAALPVAIGRDSNADIRLRDPWVSRRHCRIEEANGAVVVRDLGSKYGTMLNRHPITESVLPADAELLLGLTSVRVALSEHPYS